MIIEEIFNIADRGLVITAISDGRIKVGDTYRLSSGLEFEVRGIESHRVPWGKDEGQLIGVLLPASMKRESLVKGMKIIRVESNVSMRACAVDAVVIKVLNNMSDEPRVLLVRRRYEPFRDQWVLPGGFVDANETAEDAVVREVLEETGVQVKNPRLLGVWSSPERDPRQNISITFLCEVNGNTTVKSSNEGQPSWLPLKGTITQKLGFDHNDILDEGAAVWYEENRSVSV